MLGGRHADQRHRQLGCRRLRAVAEPECGSTPSASAGSLRRRAVSTSVPIPITCLAARSLLCDLREDVHGVLRYYVATATNLSIQHAKTGHYALRIISSAPRRNC